MDEYKQIITPKFYKRAIAILVDVVICVQFFIFFQIIGNIVLNQTMNFQSEIYSYQEKLVEHKLGYFMLNEETNNKIYIEYKIGDIEDENTITQETFEARKESFNNDKEAIRLTNLVTTTTLIATSIELLLAILPNYLLFPLIFKNGQTIGKKLCRIAIVNKDGYKIKFKDLFMRHFIGLYVFEILVSYLCMYFIKIPIVLIASLITMLVTQNKRALHDIVANTYCVDNDLTIIYDSADDEEKIVNEDNKINV